MKIRFGSTAIIAFVTSILPAAADVTNIFTSSTSVAKLGAPVEFTLDTSVQPDAGYFNANFTGVETVTINSGAGQSMTFQVNAGGASSEFSTEFSYNKAGTYTPSYSISEAYTENYYYTGIVGWNPYTYISGYNYYYYACGPFESFTCSGITYHYATGYNPVYGQVTGTSYYPATGGGSLSVSAVPEPASWALMLIGFGGLGYGGYRRRPGASALAES